MKDPKRWLDDAGSPSDARRLLDAARDVEPPDDAQDAVWAALAGRIGPFPGGGGPGAGPAPAGGGAGASAAKTAGATAKALGMAKAIAAGVLSASVLVGGYSWLAPAGDAPPRAEVPAPAPLEPPAPPTARRADALVNDTPVPNDAPLATDAPAPALGVAREAARGTGGGAPTGTLPGAHQDTASLAGPPPAAATAAATGPLAGASPADVGGPAPAPTDAAGRATRLKEESALLGQARGALRSGDAAGALRLLSLSTQRFPSAMLTQEREALTIEALAQSGQRDAARARAQAFLAAYPGSLHAERVSAFAR